MRRLLLYRHAKSAWDDPALDDFERPLAPRGRLAAPRMARAMAEMNWLPDRIVASPAERARQTWALAAPLLPNLPKPIFSKDLYMASPAALLKVVRATPPEVVTLLLLGHNPGLERFAGKLAGAGSDEQAYRRLLRKFPTAALAFLELEAEWARLSWSGARLVHFLRPRDLE